MAGSMQAPNYVTMMGYDPISHLYVPVQTAPVQTDSYNNEQYGVIQVNQSGGSGGGITDITIHDYTTTTQHLKVNADGSINVNASGSASSTAINDPTITTQKLAVDANGHIGLNNYPATQAVSGTVGINTLPTLPTGGNVIGHVIVDSAGAVTITTLPSLPAGSNVIGHVIVDSAAGVVISSLPSIPAGTNLIGHVDVDNFPTTQVISGTVSISDFPITQPVSGSVNIGTMPAVNIAAASGGISTTSTNGATIAATTDYAITFSSQVSHWALENNTSATIQWELDATTNSATSLHLPSVAPGNLLLMDVKVTVIHVYSTVATAFNTATGICVRGWA